MAKKFQFYKQLETIDCGATCLRMIARHFGRYYSLDYLRALTHQNLNGSSLLGISDAAEHIGMHTVGAKMTFSRLTDDIPLPSIAFWRDNHFVVLIEANRRFVRIADPASGIHKLSKENFMAGWVGDEKDDGQQGVVLLMEPTSDFYDRDGQTTDKSSFRHVFQNIWKYKALLVRLGLGVLLGSFLLATFPFIIQAIVDEGVDGQDFNLVLLIMVAWVALHFCQMGLEAIRNLILQHIGSKVNIRLLTDFMLKALKLPIHFFTTKMTDDIVQRLYDNSRVEHFLTTEFLSVVFSTVIILIFGSILWYFDPIVFLIFFIASCFNILWVRYFLKKRKNLDYKRYDHAAETHSKLTDLIRGMEEIKLNNAEKNKRWDWESSEAKLYRINKEYEATKSQAKMGARFIDGLKNILIITFAARAVIQEEEITLGIMMAILFIVAQLNAPIRQLVEFAFSYQDTKNSLERMNEIHQMENEENPLEKVDVLPNRVGLRGEKVSFRYEGADSPMVLKNINFKIPYGKTTAIIGSSGSGKTTLLKLLLNFFQPTEGKIYLGDMNLNNVQNSFWRKKCGVVMQEGYLFSDTIAKNIALGDGLPDNGRLLAAAKIANIQAFIDSLSRGYNTSIGSGGKGLSMGQKQRILIARAVYENPEYLFFDEATNDLDSVNEEIILKNIRRNFGDRTVVLIANTLSSVIHADNIILLEAGKIVEEGTHNELAERRGAYYELLGKQWKHIGT